MGAESSTPSSKPDQEIDTPALDNNNCNPQSEELPLPPILKHREGQALPRTKRKKVRFDLGEGDPISRANEERVRFKQSARLEIIREVDEIRLTAYGEFGRSLRR